MKYNPKTPMKSEDLQGTTLQGFHRNEYFDTGGIPRVCQTQEKRPFQRNWGLPGNMAIDSIAF